MELSYKANGDLTPGIIDMTWEEFKSTFSYNLHRSNLFKGIELAIKELKAVGCKTIYMDGSFISKKEQPQDFDLCWDEEGVNYKLIVTEYPGLMDYGWRMKNMKKRYGGDIVPMTSLACYKKGLIFLAYFMQDKQSRDKGIIRISLI